MFEHYSDAAKRVVFFARYESAWFGSDVIETWHALLGLLRYASYESPVGEFLSRFGLSLESVRVTVMNRVPIIDSASADAKSSLSGDLKDALMTAYEYSASLNHGLVAPPHILVGLLRQDGTWVADFLAERGLTVELIQRDLLNWDQVESYDSEPDEFNRER